jgi:hypothetical protein
MEPSTSAELSAHLESVLGEMNPGDPKNPANWPAWARLLPHLLRYQARGKAGRTEDPTAVSSALGG